MDIPQTTHFTPTPTCDGGDSLPDEGNQIVSSGTPMFVQANEQFPLELLASILLGLYRAFSDDYEYQRGNVLRRTLAACRLVCRRWSRIVKLKKDGFIIRAYNKEWPSPRLTWSILRRTLPRPTDEVELNQEDNSRWLPEDYTAALLKTRPKFLPDLMPNMIAGISLHMKKYYSRDDYKWEEEKGSVIQSTLAACCLVCHEWNRIFTPVLYENILLRGKKSLLTRSLLLRTFQHTKPTHKALVRTMTIELADDGSTANSLSISFNFPNLHKLIIALPDVPVDPATLHSNFAQNLQSLSRCCAIQMRGDLIGKEIAIQWQSLPIWINFIRRSRLIPCGLFANGSGDRIFYSKTYFYIGKQEASAEGSISSSDIKPFQKYLTQTGHNLRGLYLSASNPSSLPEIDLRKNPHLRLLKFDFSLWKKKIRDSQDDVIKWFNSICESVTSRSLVVGLDRLSNESEICNKIQNMLLALHARIETLSVFLSIDWFWGQDVDLKDVRKLFSRLYEAGIVVEKLLYRDGDEARAIAFGR